MTAQRCLEQITPDPIRAMPDQSNLDALLFRLASGEQRDLVRALVMDTMEGTMSPLAAAARRTLIQTSTRGSSWSIEQICDSTIWETI